MAHKTTKRIREDNEDDSPNEKEFSELNLMNNNWPHFLVIESNDHSRPVTSLSPFVIDKSLKACAGTVKSVKKLRSGIILVEVNREAQSANLMAMNSILDLSVNVSAHRSMNTCKGVVRSYDLAQTSETELLSELSSQGVTHVQHIFVTRDGQKKRTNTLIMTFAQSTPPNYISAGYLKVPVDIYYPSPLRCFNCQQFGHHRATCKHTAVCAFCGLAHHGDSPCTSPKS